MRAKRAILPRRVKLRYGAALAFTLKLLELLAVGP